MLFYTAIFIASVFVIYRTYNKCKNIQNDFTKLFRDYEPKRGVISANKLQDNLLMKSLSFFNYPKSHMTHRLFKTIEFFTAETIISHCIDIMKCDDSYKNIKSIVKITNLIDEYKNIFPGNDEVIDSLIYKIYMNCLNIETDVYMLYKTLNEVLKSLTKRTINSYILYFYKNYYWSPHLQYKVKHLIYFIKTNVKK
jgi:hypothetical protein